MKSLSSKEVSLAILIGGIIGLIGICLPIYVWCIQANMNPWNILWLFLLMSVSLIGIGLYLLVMS